MANKEFPSSTLFHFPILLLLGDGKEHTHKEFMEKIIEIVGVSEEARKETLKDGTNKFSSWTYFAIRNLKDANLIESKIKGSGKYIITEEGRELLSLKPNGFKGGPGKSLISLKEALGIKSVKNNSDLRNTIINEPSEASAKSILVRLGDLAASANATLPDSLLEAIKHMKPQLFEVLIKKLLVAMNYGKSQDDVIVTRYSGDNGIDGYVRKDRFGIEKLCAYQAKRYTTSNVGIEEMNALGGAMINCGTKCGIMVTTTDFTAPAKEYNPEGFKIIRLTGKALVAYLIEYGIGVKTECIEVKTVDVDFFNNL